MNIEKDLQEGERLFESGEIDKAEVLFKEVLLKEPENQPALNNIGVIAFSRGEHAAAEAYFSKASAGHNEYLWAMSNLADLYEQQGRIAEAIVQLSRCVELSPGEQELSSRLKRLRGQTTSTDKAEQACAQLMSWLETNGWDGWDPYDVQDFYIQTEKGGVKVSEADRHNIDTVDKIDPLRVRQELGIPKKRIAKGLGLLMAANARMYKAFDRVECLEEAEALADWLLANPSPGYQNVCWGYPFDWASLKMIPIYTPSSVVSTTVGDGLWELYTITREQKYLDACISICRFIVEDLNVDDMGENGICFSYTPIDDFHVHNANLFCAEFLGRIGTEIENTEWIGLAERATQYALSEQKEDGSIIYWGKFHNFSHTKIDHYHSGFEIRCLSRIAKYTGSAKIKDSFYRYLEFYLKNYLFEDGLPKYAPDKPYPVDIHGAAEGVLMMSMLSEDHPDLLPLAEQTLGWTIDNMQHAEGWFAYKWEPGKRVDIPHLRWGQAWMLRAFSEFFTARKKASGEWGSYDGTHSTPGRKAAIEAKPTTSDTAAAPKTSPCKKNCSNTTCEQNAAQLVKPALQGEGTGNFQITMPSAAGHDYGSREWADSLFRGAEEDPWGHDWRASQLARYVSANALLERNLAVAQVGNVIDVGCALGHFTTELASRYSAATVLGVDISETAINKCRQRYSGIDFGVAKLPELDGINGSFDLVSALEVIFYVQDTEACFARLNSIMKPGGHLLISTYLGKPPFHTSSNFKDCLSKHFLVIDEEVRHHLAYYEYEAKVRGLMSDLEALGAQLSSDSQKPIKEYLQAGISFLGNPTLLEELNSHARNAEPERLASHSIVLARKL